MLHALREYVSRYTVFSDEEFDVISQKVKIRRFEKKEKVIGIGEMENHLNFVVRGLARKYFIRGRDEVITQIAKESDLINSSFSFLNRTPSTYIVETIEPTVFFSITKDDLELLYQQNHKMEHLGRLIVTALFLQKEEWDHERMRLNTRERFVEFVRNNSDLLQRVPQKYLASYLNIKPETFSRLKHLLRKKK
jgi:CRP-like cAMP-binding protein